jgi:hypothetical protein
MIRDLIAQLIASSNLNQVHPLPLLAQDELICGLQQSK